ncbi:MAG TPA: hypothetical protein VFO16_22825 [Pseudonocardiaceae bacterium]|nr:hypothetical protein [Pseudonocardiaceae bacterium]
MALRLGELSDPADLQDAIEAGLFEIVYPSNRIVSDYGAADDVYLLGMVSRRDGRLPRPRDIAGWPGPIVAQFTYTTLAAPPREGAEGLVVDLVRRLMTTPDRVERIITAGADCKAFALLVKNCPHAGALFGLFQGHEIDSYLWREARPEHELPYKKIDKAVA